MPSSLKSPLSLYLLVAISSAAIFGIDLMTRVGMAEWLLYLIPVALCLFQPTAFAPPLVALLQIVLLIFGLLYSPEGMDVQIGIINRVMGALVLLGVAFLETRIIVERNRAQRLIWLQQGDSAISNAIIGELDVDHLGDKLLSALVSTLDAQVALLYRFEGGALVPTASYALERPLAQQPHLAPGQGLPGEVARDGAAVIVSDLPDDYLVVNSGVGRSAVKRLLIAPATADGAVIGVVEIGFIQARADLERARELMTIAAEAMGVAMRSAIYRKHLGELLEETRRQSEELQTQQEELRRSNEELEEQSRALRDSQAELEQQQADLEAVNVQLEERSRLLEMQKADLQRSQRALERNAEELERANRYKSEFLANMSHELRTPLNSSLILSQILSDNRGGTLTPEQVRYAQTIHAANNDLLALINDILDLSKIEAGHMEMRPETIALDALLDPLRRMFEPIAKNKSLAFRVAMADGLPLSLMTDGQRLTQVLRNLLSNAFKFTERGEVTLEIAPRGEKVAFTVRDTGIGIAEEQQDVIFEAFRQADGSTSRVYGGTGLGLSISRELARLLGGEIRVESAPGLGSSFTLEVAARLESAQAELPRQATASGSAPAARERSAASTSRAAGTPAPSSARATKAVEAAEAAPQSIPDDRNARRRDRLILIIEDDTRFAAILYELAHELGFDCIHAATGDEGFALAASQMPNAILLDVGLPDQSGLGVLERLKREPETRHIPIHMISVDDHTHAALEMGAVGFALKPVAREGLIAAIRRLEDQLQKAARRIMVVEDNAPLRENLALLLAADDVDITTAGTVAEALERLSNATFDCMVMDLMLPDASGYQLLEKMASGGKYSFPPVIVYTGRNLDAEEEQRLRRYSRSIIIKGARSPERLLDEVTLFLHRVEADLPADQRELLQQARQRDAAFEGRRILIAEDDVRNIFALTSILEPLGAELVVTRNGREALDAVRERRDIDLVLMDLMMPEMDGLTAIRAIRKLPEATRLPIIALTAKAMRDDRQHCLDAGANDYIAKPIDVNRLVSLCRVWMPR
ncbi:response regulator [Noviherbaspirillum pedocola]|uniref:Virulence sensor protein BvgS n=1 Tax=Noviherbaspirillum pedocola TaxID=2801341 RepID=A0A934SU90_9BURK|nr:response regulator [Noviherbaspirillum pedocola]MBK4735664.1 response regulator [Noviherbaspirillum pedocola]